MNRIVSIIPPGNYISLGMERDRRYELVQPLISAGRIQTFQDIFYFVPKTVIARDLGMNNSRFTELIKNVNKFVLKDIFRLAELFQIDDRELFRLIYEQYLRDKKNKKKKIKGE